jgi:multidrug efflux system membrane fusion protein
MKSSVGKWIVRLGIAAVAVGGIIWFLRSRAEPQVERDAHAAQSGDPLSAKPGDKSGAKSGDPAAAGGARAVPVLTTPAVRKDVPIWLDGLGSVAAFKQVTVHSQVDGRLDQVLFKEGQQVRAGEALAQIDPRPFQVQLHQAEGALTRDRAQLEDARLNLNRFKDLRSKNLIAQQQVDDQNALVGQAEGATLVDQAAIEAAKLNLDYARVKAPFDGVVGVRLVDPGNLVHASDPSGLVILTQLDPAAVFFTLPQDDLPRVQAAQLKGELAVEAWSRDGLTRLGAGKLAVIDNQINQATSTIRLKALFPNPQRMLWPNQFVKARLLLETEHDALVVPAASVQRGPQGTFVYVVAPDQTAAVKSVKVALQSGELAVIGEGLDGGEQVVIEGQNQLRPGTPVSVRPQTVSGKPEFHDRGRLPQDKPPQSPAPQSPQSPPSPKSPQSPQSPRPPRDKMPQDSK